MRTSKSVNERAHLTLRESLRAGIGTGVLAPLLFLVVPIVVVAGVGELFGAGNSPWAVLGAVVVGLVLWVWRVFAIGAALRDESLVIKNLFRNHHVPLTLITAIQDTQFHALGWMPAASVPATPGFAVVVTTPQGTERIIKIVATLSDRPDSNPKRFVEELSKRFDWPRRPSSD